MSIVLLWIKRAWNWIKEALFPTRCVLCRGLGFALHSDCGRFDVYRGSVPKFKPINQCFIGFDYGDPKVKKVIDYFKFQGFADLAEPLAQKIVERNFFIFTQNPVLVPVPLHWTRMIWRGFNQAAILTQKIQKYYPHLDISYGLKRFRRTKQQAKLSKKQRFNNLRNAFKWQGKEVPESVLLIDDVTTTGATLSAAAKTLKQAGAKEVYALVIAKGK